MSFALSGGGKSVSQREMVDSVGQMVEGKETVRRRVGGGGSVGEVPDASDSEGDSVAMVAAANCGRVKVNAGAPLATPLTEDLATAIPQDESGPVDTAVPETVEDSAATDAVPETAVGHATSAADAAAAGSASEASEPVISAGAESDAAVTPAGSDTVDSAAAGSDATAAAAPVPETAAERTQRIERDTVAALQAAAKLARPIPHLHKLRSLHHFKSALRLLRAASNTSIVSGTLDGSGAPDLAAIGEKVDGSVAPNLTPIGEKVDGHASGHTMGGGAVGGGLGRRGSTLSVLLEADFDAELRGLGIDMDADSDEDFDDFDGCVCVCLRVLMCV